MTDQSSGKPTERKKDSPSSHRLMERSHINKDTYLNCWCPHCEAALNEDRKAVFKITTKAGEEGISKMSPYLNVLDRETAMTVEDDEELADVRCPHCDKSLIVTDQVCKFDNCKMMRFLVSVADSIKLQLTLCVVRTCRWYIMSDEDNERLILRDSHEW